MGKCAWFFLIVRQRIVGLLLLLQLLLLLSLLLWRLRRQRLQQRQRRWFLSSTPSSWQQRCITATAGGAQLPLAAPLPPSLVPLPGFFLALLLLMAPAFFILQPFCFPPFNTVLSSELVLSPAAL